MEWGVMGGIRKGGNGSVGGTGTDGNIKRKREKNVKRRRREKEKKKESAHLVLDKTLSLQIHAEQ